MLSILYNERDEVELADNKQFLKDALDSIFKIKEAKINANEEGAYTIIGTIYDLSSPRGYPYRSSRINNSNPRPFHG